jgi:hypothetical protein
LKRNIVLIALVVIAVLAFGACSNVFNNEMEKGKVALNNKEYDLAILSFTNALKEKPDNKEVLDLILQAHDMKIAALRGPVVIDLKNYVAKVMDIHTRFLEQFSTTKTMEDVDLLYKIKTEADFTPPKFLYDVHRIYVAWINKMFTSSELYVKGNRNQNAQQISQALIELEEASSHFSEYRDKFNYLIQDLKIEKAEIDWFF